MECRKLKDLWYNHLKNNGFEDIEAKEKLKKQFNPIGLLGDCNNTFADTEKPFFFERQNHFLWAANMLSHGVFKSTSDKLIWEFYAEGTPRRRIQEIIGSGMDVARRIKKIQKYLREQSRARRR